MVLIEDGLVKEKLGGQPMSMTLCLTMKVIVAIRHGGVLERQQLSCSKVSIPKKEKDGDLCRPSDIIFVH